MTDQWHYGYFVDQEGRIWKYPSGSVVRSKDGSVNAVNMHWIELCRADHKAKPSLKERFQRACHAFVNAWRTS